MPAKTFSDTESEADSETMTDTSVDATITSTPIKAKKETTPIPDFISENIKKGLTAMGITSLFDVQKNTIDYSISGLDMVVQARTGSGKTLAFALPTMERLVSSNMKIRKNQPRVLVLAPTRELAVQIDRVFNEVAKFTDMNSIAVYGGASYTGQKQQLASGKGAVVVGTPGRVKDMVNNGYIDLSKVKVVILDEVDRMLDMGFAEDVEEILSFAPYTADPENPDKKVIKPQTLFYSATCPQWVQDKAGDYMDDDYQHVILVDDVSCGGTSKDVEHLSIKIDRFEGVATCVRDLVRLYSAGRKNGRAIVFTQTKQEANDLALGDVSIGDAQVMHGDIEQKQREITLKGFREGKFRCLVATDVAARGLDIPQIDLVVQTSPPRGGDIESYVHRSGRTGRAGKKGVCVCIYSFKNKRNLRDIERATGVKFRDIPIPQPVDVAKSVMAEKLEEDIKTVINDKDKQFENFQELSKTVVKMCESDKDKAICCLLNYIAQGGEDLNSRSMLSGAEGYQTWLMETDNDSVKSPVGLIKSILARNGVDNSCFEEIKTWRLYAGNPDSFKSGGTGVAFDLRSDHTNLILESWEDGDKKKSGRETVMLKKCGTTLPQLQEFRGGFSGSGGRGGGYGGRGGGRSGGRFGGSGGNRRDSGFGGRGQKRSFGEGNSRSSGRGGKRGRR